MPGSNCCMVGCPATKGRNRGLTFHKLPIVKKHNDWRRKLIGIINRSDSSFNAERATICSRHFTLDCFRTCKFIFQLLIHYIFI